MYIYICTYIVRETKIKISNISYFVDYRKNYLSISAILIEGEDYFKQLESC